VGRILKSRVTITRRAALGGIIVSPALLSRGPARAWYRSVAPYLGLVATRAQSLALASSSFSYANSRSFHIARTDFNKVQVVLPAWYANGGEQPAAGNISYQASVEYPAGTFHPFSFGGSASGTTGAGLTLFSDLLTLPVTIPTGATFFMRVFQDASASANGIMYGFQGYPAGGDGMEASATIVSSKTASGTVSWNGLGPVFPTAIAGPTTAPSVICIGDSRVVGISDTMDTSGDVGEHCRSIGPHFAYTSLAASGENGFNFCNFFNANPMDSLQRRTIGNLYGSHILFNYGVNDISNAITFSQLQQILPMCWGLFPGKRVFHTTIAPDTNSSDSWKTAGHQTPKANFSFSPTGTRQEVNDWLRRVPRGLTGCFEVSGVIEPVLNDGLWKVNGTENWYTADGTHETQAACRAIELSGEIDHTKIYF
jgi:hypothetical protein